MQGPRADFACLSKKCQQDGGATVYELPVGAKRCPVCGSVRISRLYNAVNVSSGMARRVDKIVEPVVSDARAMKDEGKQAVQNRRICPPLAVPIQNGRVSLEGSYAARQFPQLATMGMGFPTGGAKPLPQSPTRIPLPPVKPTQVYRDREWTIKNGKPARA